MSLENRYRIVKTSLIGRRVFCSDPHLRPSANVAHNQLVQERLAKGDHARWHSRHGTIVSAYLEEINEAECAKPCYTIELDDGSLEELMGGWFLLEQESAPEED